MQATSTQTQTALALITRIDSAYQVAKPIVQHVAVTVRTALLVVIKLTLVAILMLVKFALEKLEAGETTSNEYINKTSEEIRDRTNAALLAAWQAVPEVGSDAVDYIVSVWTEVSKGVGQGSFSALRGFEKDFTRVLSCVTFR